MNVGLSSVRLLLVEDEQRLAENIAEALRETGLAVDHAADGRTGSHLAEQGVYDAIVLDLMLPEKSGQRVLKDLRQNKLHTPVLILTAQEGKESVIELLNGGADDYLAKPFDLGELIARVKALIRRGKGVSTAVFTVSDVELNTIQQTVVRRGHSIDLSPTEYRILEYIAHRPRAHRLSRNCWNTCRLRVGTPLPMSSRCGIRWGEVDRVSAAHHGLLDCIQFHIGDCKDGGGDPFSAPDQCLDTRDQLSEVEGLGQVVVAPPLSSSITDSLPS